MSSCRGTACLAKDIRFLETPNGSPLASGTNTPRRIELDTRHIDKSVRGKGTDLPIGGTKTVTINPEPATKVSAMINYDSDIDPDELLPVYLETKAKIFHLQALKTKASSAGAKRMRGQEALKSITVTEQLPMDPEIAKLQRKLKKIEGDILFDQYIADRQWEKQRIQLERDAAAERRATAIGPPERLPHLTEVLDSLGREVARETSRITAEVLEENSSDDDTAIADLFASLPVTEVDPVNGKSSVVINSSNGTKVTIRDFGKSTGISPKRVLEEACRARLDTKVLSDIELLTIIYQGLFSKNLI
jgi:ATP-dependent RNA helicase DHX29